MESGQPIHIIYDTYGCDGTINGYMGQLQATLDLYGQHINMTELQRWDMRDANLGHIVYIASAETEEFHKKVRKKFVERSGKSFLVLAYPTDGEKQVKRLLKLTKEQLKNKKMSPENVDAAMKRIVKVTDMDNISSWWPRVLHTVCKPLNVKKSREIGVYFKMNPDDEDQMEWFDEQRNVMEKEFHLSCRYGDGIISEEKYIQNCVCVVMYVEHTRRLSAGRDSTQRNRETCDKVKATMELCNKHNTRFQVYVDEAGGDLNTMIEQTYGMRMVGTDGMMPYWIGLLSLLNIIEVRPRTDTLFHSDLTEEVGQSRFDTSRHPNIFGSRETRRPITCARIGLVSPTGVRPGPFIKRGITYQPAKGDAPLIVDSFNTRPRINCMCFPFR